MNEQKLREAKNAVCIRGHLNKALNNILSSNQPDAVFAILTELAHESVNIGFCQALATTEPEPFDEREAFEREMSCEEIWGHRSLTKKPDGRYRNWCVDLMWAVWQARAAMSQVGDINVVESFTNDTKDAERYRWLRDIAPTLGNRAPHVTQYPGQSFDKTTYLDATKVGLDAAIDAAMAKGVK